MSRRDFFWPAYCIAMTLFLFLWIDQMETDRVIAEREPVTVPADPLPCVDDVALKLAASRNERIECAP